MIAFNVKRVAARKRGEANVARRELNMARREAKVAETDKAEKAPAEKEAAATKATRPMSLQAKLLHGPSEVALDVAPDAAANAASVSNPDANPNDSALAEARKMTAGALVDRSDKRGMVRSMGSNPHIRIGSCPTAIPTTFDLSI